MASAADSNCGSGAAPRAAALAPRKWRRLRVMAVGSCGEGSGERQALGLSARGGRVKEPAQPPCPASQGPGDKTKPPRGPGRPARGSGASGSAVPPGLLLGDEQLVDLGV